MYIETTIQPLPNSHQQIIKLQVPLPNSHRQLKFTAKLPSDCVINMVLRRLIAQWELSPPYGEFTIDHEGRRYFGVYVIKGDIIDLI